MPYHHSIALYNVRSAHNVGAIFRTADAVGISNIYLIGYTPAPIDRFGRVQPDIAKTALGAEKTVHWEQYENVEELIAVLRTGKAHIIAVEQCERAVDYKTFTPSSDTVFIFGNEVGGLPSDIISNADSVLEIPMRGTKESLNVSVSAGIVLYRALDR